MRFSKLFFIIAIITLGGSDFSHAQNVIATRNNANKTPSVYRTRSNYHPYNMTSNQIAITNSIVSAFNEESEDESEMTTATIGESLLSFECVGPEGCELIPMGGMESECVVAQATTNATKELEDAFNENMDTFEEEISNLIGENVDSLSNCGDAIETVIGAIDCQRMRVDLAFSDLSGKEEALLNKQNIALYGMLDDQLKTEVTLNDGTDSLCTSCAGASSRKVALDVAENTKENYARLTNLVTDRTSLSAEALNSTSSCDKDYSTVPYGAELERYDSTFAFKNENDDDETTFNDEGYIQGIDKSTITSFMPDTYKFDQVFPKANINYAKMVLDRDAIKDNKHLFVANTNSINLINPLPEKIDLEDSLKSDFASGSIIKKKSRQARYSLASDIINFSTAFRTSFIDEGQDSTEDSDSGAIYIKERLKSLGADELTYKSIGNTMSEYQFLDALVNKIPNTPGYYAISSGDDIPYIDKSIIRSLSTTLAIKWKQYQLLEKILAVRAAELAVKVDN